MDVSTLKKKTLTSMIWKSAENIGTQGIQFVVSIVLARLLVPNDYGVVAVITVFLSLAMLFVERGFGYALIQKKNIETIDIDTVFILNIVVSGILYFVLFAIAPLIASIYENVIYIPLLRILSITLIFGGISNTLSSVVARSMDFRKQFIAALIAIILSGATGISMAVAGYGAWALVSQQLVSRIVTCIALWISVRYVPHLSFSKQKAKDMFSFSWKLLLVSIISTTKNSIRSLVIGKVYTIGDLAYFEKGRLIPTNFETIVNYTLQSVSFSAFSKLQDDLPVLKSMVRRMVRICSFILIPIMIGLAACAYNLVYVLLSEKWIACVPYMQLVCLSMTLSSINAFSLNALNAIGRSDINLRRNIIIFAVDILLLIIAVQVSMYAIAVSLVISSLVGFGINLKPLNQHLDYKMLEQIKDLLPSLAISAIMYFVVYQIGELSFSHITSLMIQMGGGIIVYVSLSLIFKVEPFFYLCNVIKSYFTSRRQI